MVRRDKTCLGKVLWARFFFVGFVVISSFGILNLIIGVITERTHLVQRDYEEWAKLKKDHKMVQNIVDIAKVIFKKADDAQFLGQNGVLTKSQMVDAMEDHEEELQEYIDDIDL